MSDKALRIDHALLLPMDGPAADPRGQVRRASIRIRADRIEAIGELEPIADEDVFDATGLIALPGFVQGHLHCCQTLFRGLADDLPLLRWLRERILPLEAAHDADSMRASAELSVAELLLGGTTSLQSFESVRHTEQVFEVAERHGLTLISGNCLIDIDSPELPRGFATGGSEALAITDELRRDYHGRGRLRVAVTPRYLLSCSPETGASAAAYAKGYGLRLHTHAAEHPDECAEVERRFGKRYLQVLADQGQLGRDTGLAHCVQLDCYERELLVSSGTAVLHCPGTNLKLGSGIAEITDYWRRGVPIALGADGAPANNRLSALSELRLAALLQARVAGPGAWPTAQALFALTAGGASALGLDDVGSLRVGKRADLLLLDPPSFAADDDPVAAVVWSGGDEHVRHVMVGGRWAVRDRKLLDLDLETLQQRAREQRASVLSRAGLSR